MRFKCGKNLQERAEELNRLQALRDWHHFYAILPREVAAGDCRAFEWIERRYVDGYYAEESYWEYREALK